MDESIVKHLVPADLDEASRLLLKAADLIETHGHCKGRTQDMEGRFCAIGALIHVGGFATEAVGRLRRAVPGCWIANWNNAPERTAEEVISTMRRVALGG